VLQEALRAYVQRGAATSVTVAPGSSGERGETIMPQLSQSFIDRLVELSAESSDMEYRQKLTNRIIDEGVTLAQLARQMQYYDAMRGAFSGPGGQSSNLVEEVKATTEHAYQEIARTADQVSALFDRVSEQNLNPNAVLYTITSPLLVATRSSLTWRTILFYLAIIMFVALIAIPLSCLVHAYFRESISQAGPPKTDGTTRERDARHIAGV
jgi:hypothetical protein